MKSYWPLLVASVGLLATGCRNNAAQELLERDLRRQEDQIFALESKLAEYQALLEAAQCGSGPINQTTIAEPSPASSAPSMRRIEEIPARRGAGGDTFTPPVIELPEQAPPFRAPPEIQPPDPGIPDGELPAVRGSSTAVPPAQPPGIDLQLASASPRAAEPVIPEPSVPGEITGIGVNPRVTRGYAVDERPGDDGVTVLIEPRGVNGKPSDTPTQMSIVVMDPALVGEASRVARWDFTESEIADRWRSSPDGKGWRFDLRWPTAPPKHSQLVAHIRCMKGDGTKLDAEAPITIDLPAAPPQYPVAQPRAQQWTRSTRPTPRMAAPAPMRTTPMSQPMMANNAERWNQQQPSPRVILTDPDAPGPDLAAPQRNGGNWSPYR
ncbi:MAG TPA: hypothetical protein VG713_00545 [Pirellulales bacterium]|nr:hypothetical protein [Pirellulales bacterium]